MWNMDTKWGQGFSLGTGVIFTTVHSTRVSSVGMVRLSLTVTVRVCRVSVTDSVSVSIK